MGKYLKELAIFTFILLQGASGRIVIAPLNVMNTNGSRLEINCRSDTTTSPSQISWYFEQFSTNYTATVVTGCVPLDTNAFTVKSSSEGECNLVISSLDGRYAGTYTCYNGDESPVAAQVGVIVSGPSCTMMYTPLPLVDGDYAVLSCSAAESSYYGVHEFIQNVVTQAKPQLSSNAGSRAVNSDGLSQETQSDWIESPTFSWQGNFSFLAEKPTLQQYSYKLNFTTRAFNPPMGNATNNPTYQFLYVTPALPVSYSPESNQMSISGCSSFLPPGYSLTCSATSFPASNYTWIHPDGITSPGATVTLGGEGQFLNYTCLAENNIGTAAKTCIVTVDKSASSGVRTGWSIVSTLICLMTVHFGLHDN